MTLFHCITGLKIVVPSNSYDAKGLMIQAIRDDNPVMYFFHKGIMGLPWMAYFTGSTNHVPEESYTIPFGQAKIVREGTDVTLVTLSQMVHKSTAAAEKLAQDGISVEIIDLRTIVPLDKDTVLNSVRKTGRLCIADENHLTLFHCIPSCHCPLHNHPLGLLLGWPFILSDNQFNHN